MVKIYTVNNTQIFGKRIGQVVTGVVRQNDMNETMVQYLKNRNAGTLVTVEFSEVTSVMTEELSVHAALSYRALKAQFKAAQSMAEGWAVNQVFDEFRKK